MNTYELKTAYADWICSNNKYDLFITLNSEVELTFEEMSKLLCKLFYKTECDVFTYEKRELYKTKCRIERVCVIENYNKRTHAHLQVKTLSNFTNEQMIELLKEEYKQLTKTKEKQFLFDASVIADRQAVSRYTTKDTNKQNKLLNDVIDLRSSFICKHSNKR